MATRRIAGLWLAILLAAPVNALALQASEGTAPHRATSPGNTGPALRLAVWPGTLFNRVEGFRVLAGPVLEARGDRPWRIETRVAWRTEWPRELEDRPGYLLRAERAIAPDEALWFGLAARSTVQPIQTWDVGDLENSLSALLFRQDLRDYYLRRGWSAYLRYQPTDRAPAMTLVYAVERHASVSAADPSTLFRSDAGWREQPEIVEGRFRLVSAEVRWPGDAALDPSAKGASRPVVDDAPWALRARLTRSGEPRLGQRGGGDGAGEAGPAVAPGLLEILYTKRVDVGRRALDEDRADDPVVHLRLMLAGDLGDPWRQPLPPQFQLALGGPGSLPGHAPFEGDCRPESVVSGSEAPASQPRRNYCDRIALATAELRFPGLVPLSIGRDAAWAEPLAERLRAASPELVFFANAGRGWTLERPDGDPWTGHPWRVPARRSDLYDAGIALRLDGAGIYLAVPIDHRERRAPRLTVRLHRGN